MCCSYSIWKLLLFGIFFGNCFVLVKSFWPARTKLFESSKNCLNSAALDTGAQALILFPGNKLSQQYSVFSPIPASAEWSVTGLFALAKSVYLNSEDHPVARRFNGSYLLVIDACSVSDISSCEVWFLSTFVAYCHWMINFSLFIGSGSGSVYQVNVYQSAAKEMSMQVAERCLESHVLERRATRGYTSGLSARSLWVKVTCPKTSASALSFFW